MVRLSDPFAEFDRIFDTVGGRYRGMQMPMDAFERDGTYVLRFDLAGADPDDVDLTVEHGLLTVTAVRQREDVEGVNWLVRERPTGTHSRQVRLGDRLDTGNVDADYAGGVLTVRIPLRPESKPQKVQISRGDHRGADADRQVSIDA